MVKELIWGVTAALRSILVDEVKPQWIQSVVPVAVRSTEADAGASPVTRLPLPPADEFVKQPNRNKAIARIALILFHEAQTEIFIKS